MNFSWLTQPLLQCISPIFLDNFRIYLAATFLYQDQGKSRLYGTTLSKQDCLLLASEMGFSLKEHGNGHKKLPIFNGVLNAKKVYLNFLLWLLVRIERGQSPWVRRGSGFSRLSFKTLIIKTIHIFTRQLSSAIL